MKCFRRATETREILAITYKDDVIFELRSAALRPGADNEVGRVANVIHLLPETVVDVEVHIDSNGIQDPYDNLKQGRVRSVRDALMRQGVDAKRIRATCGKDSLGPVSDNTVSFKVMEGGIGSMVLGGMNVPGGCQPGC